MALSPLSAKHFKKIDWIKLSILKSTLALNMLQSRFFAWQKAALPKLRKKLKDIILLLNAPSSFC